MAEVAGLLAASFRVRLVVVEPMVEEIVILVELSFVIFSNWQSPFDADGRADSDASRTRMPSSSAESSTSEDSRLHLLFLDCRSA